MTTPRPSFHPSLPGAFLIGTLAAVASAFAGCQPGALPCDSDEWRDVCQGAASGGGSGSGSGGSTGGSGGMTAGGMGGMTGGMGGMAGGTVTAATAIEGCAAFPTMGAMDMFFAMRCGNDGTCHTPALAAVWGDFKTAEVWKRVPDIKSKSACSGASLIDTADHTKGVLWQKTLTEQKCPDGKTAVGMRMPMKIENQALMLLTAAETACLEGFLKNLKK